VQRAIKEQIKMEITERKDLWLEVERIAAEWSESLGAAHPAFPLERLRPLWNTNHRLMASDHLQLETLARENMLLKFELTQLKRELEHATNDARYRPVSSVKRVGQPI
jgi:regulator of replication initiation timing